MRRFFRANSNFFTQVVVQKKAIRAEMLKNAQDFPGIKAPEAAPPAAGTSPAAASKSRQLTEGERQQIRSETLVDDDWARSFFKTESGRRIAEVLGKSGQEGDTECVSLASLPSASFPTHCFTHTGIPRTSTRRVRRKQSPDRRAQCTLFTRTRPRRSASPLSTRHAIAGT